MDFENNYNPQGAQPQGAYNQEPPQPQAYSQNPQYVQPQAYSQDPQYAQSQAYSQDPQYVQPVTFDLNTPQEPPKKKKGKKGLIIGLIAGVTALIATFVSLFIFTDIFKRPPSAEKRDETVKSSLTSSADRLASGLILFRNSSSAGSGSAAEVGSVKMDMQLEVGDDLLSLLTPSLEQAGIDADFLKNVDLKWDIRGDDSRAQYLLGLFVSDKEIATVDMIMDLQNSAMYLGMPGLNPYYMQADLSELGLDVATMQQSTALMQSFIGTMPTEQELQNCFRSYIDLLLKQMEDYETADKTVEIDGAKQKLYTITYHISADDLLDMTKACLEQAQRDETLKKLLTAYGDYMNGIMATANPYAQEIDLYSEFISAVQDGLDELEYAEADDENFMELTVYMDKDCKTRGIEWVLSDDGDEWTPFYWVTVTDKKQQNTEIILSDPYEEGITITGGQTIEKGVGNGTYVIAVEGEDVMEIELVNFISNEETTSGSIRLYPSSEMMDEASGGSGMSMLLGKLGFQIDLGKDTFGIHLISGDDILIGISMNVTTDGKKVDVKLPDNILTGSYAADDWAAELDLDELLGRLEKAGVPSELLESIPLA